jgi:predicted heme/steroid binding protein
VVTPQSIARALPLLTLALVVGVVATAMAMPQYASETGLACGACHEDGADAGPLTELGEDFLLADHVLPAGFAEPSNLQIWLRGLVRFLHLVGGVVWFGAIIYIHLFLTPRRFAKGLPRPEMRLGWYSIVLMAVTGTLLTIWRVDSMDELWTTAFGIVWMIKFAVFLTLVLIAAAVTTVINKRMRREAECAGGVGACGRVRFAFDGVLYDATDSASWKGGVHFNRHRAGTNLTAAIADAPHGPEVLTRIEAVGPVPEGGGEKLSRPARVFVALAYFNLILIAIVLFCASFWGWGLKLID